MMFERRAYLYFLKEYKNGKYPNQRFGQAFYNYFNLHKVSDQSQFKNLYELDGDNAKIFIYNNFSFM